jgi:hypothetical protein
MSTEVALLIVLVILGTALGIVGYTMGTAILEAVRRQRKPRLMADDLPIEYLNEHHRLLRPLRQTRHQIEKLTLDHQDSAVIKALGSEVLREADNVISDCSTLILQIDKLRKISLQKPTAVKALKALRSKELVARSEAEASQYRAAAQARESEIAHYDTAAKHADALEAVVLQAHAVVSELYAKLYTSVQNTNSLQYETESLRSGLGRLRTLRESVSEADEMSIRELDS